MKQSLWDLKLTEVKEEIKGDNNHEAIPMGFETDISFNYNYIYTYHEAIPMGFETICSE